jgi:hypothetical protein
MSQLMAWGARQMKGLELVCKRDYVLGQEELMVEMVDMEEVKAVNHLRKKSAQRITHFHTTLERKPGSKGQEVQMESKDSNEILEAQAEELSGSHHQELLYLTRKQEFHREDCTVKLKIMINMDQAVAQEDQFSLLLSI